MTDFAIIDAATGVVVTRVHVDITAGGGGPVVTGLDPLVLNDDGDLVPNPAHAPPAGPYAYDPGPGLLAVDVTDQPLVSAGATWTESAGFVMPPPEPPPPPAVPDRVTLAQARVALRRAGLFDRADSAVRSLGGEALDAWEYSNDVSRVSPLVSAMAGALDLSPDEIDTLFLAAGQIVF